MIYTYIYFFLLCGSRTLEITDHYAHGIFVLGRSTSRDHFLSAQSQSLIPRVSRGLNLWPLNSKGALMTGTRPIELTLGAYIHTHTHTFGILHFWEFLENDIFDASLFKGTPTLCNIASDSQVVGNLMNPWAKGKFEMPRERVGFMRNTFSILPHKHSR